MRYWRSRVISCMTLAAFLVADGFALARTLSQTCRCQACSELASLRAFSGSDKANVACCDDCRSYNGTAIAEDQAEDVIRSSCPCQNHQCPVCPCPGCGYCSVAKVPCTGQAADLIPPASPFQWKLLDSANCYSSPCHANRTPPPRA